jgi:hypothetical protein
MYIAHTFTKFSRTIADDIDTALKQSREPEIIEPQHVFLYLPYSFLGLRTSEDTLISHSLQILFTSIPYWAISFK